MTAYNICFFAMAATRLPSACKSLFYFIPLAQLSEHGLPLQAETPVTVVHNHSTLMKLIWTFSALLFYINAQSQIVRIQNNLRKEKSNLLLVDSSKLMNDFWAYSKTQSFLSIYRDSSYSFVSTPSILYHNGQSFLSKEKKLNLFDSVCIDFIYDYVLDYEWKERLKRNKNYWIAFTFMYNNDEKRLSIEAEEMASQYFKPVYKVEKVVQ